MYLRAGQLSSVLGGVSIKLEADASGLLCRNSHALRVTGNVVNMAIVTGIPLVEVLVQAIQPIGRGREVNNLLPGNIMRDENWDRMADEHVTSLDVTPKEVPDVGLGRSSLRDQVAADLNVRSVQNWTVRCDFLDQGDQAWHLGIINLRISELAPLYRCSGKVISTYDHNIRTPLFWWAKRPPLGEPITVRILGNPINDGLLLLRRHALVGVADALKDVVDILRNPENTRPRLWHY